MTNSHDAGIALVREFSQHLKNDYGVAVDFAIHAPDQQGDNRNYHPISYSRPENWNDWRADA